jgi:hypothetical protein
MGVQKKTRKFAQMKRVIGESFLVLHCFSELTFLGQRDGRLYATIRPQPSDGSLTDHTIGRRTSYQAS